MRCTTACAASLPGKGPQAVSLSLSRIPSSTPEAAFSSPGRISPCGSLQGSALVQQHFWGGPVPSASGSRNLWPLPATTLGSLGTLSGICLVELAYLEPFGYLCWNELPGHKMCFPRAASSFPVEH